MAFKMITLSEKEVGRIAGNAKAHAPMIAGKFTARWRKSLAKGQKTIDVEQLQLCVHDDLRKLRHDIGVIERRHLAQLETDRLSRKVRDETIPQLRAQLIGVKSIFDGSFGLGTSIKVFGEANLVIPVDPFPLRRIGFHVHDNLTAPDLVLPPLVVDGVTILPRNLAKGFQPYLARLDEVLVELEDTLPITNATLERKIKKLAQMRQEAGVAARFLEALYNLAGHDEIAKRVRISTHRSRRLDGEAVGGGDADGPAPDEPGPVEPAPAEPVPEPAPGGEEPADVAEDVAERQVAKAA